MASDGFGNYSLEQVENEVQLPYDDETAAMMAEKIDIDSETPLPGETDNPLLGRIAKPRIYLLSESSAALHGRLGKRKSDVLETEEDEVLDDDIPSDASLRPNAILLTGEPISHFPTARLFAYAGQFEAAPMGIEWVDDHTCVFVYSTTPLARAAYNQLRKDDVTQTSDGLDQSRPIPSVLWPIEDRLSKALGKGEALSAPIGMRWAKVDDVKAKDAKHKSEFYKKHGEYAGKEGAVPIDTRRKRPRRGDDVEEGVAKWGHDKYQDEGSKKAQLDAELDSFLKNGPEDGSPRSHSRSRSRSPRSRLPLNSRVSDRRIASLPRSRQGRGGRRQQQQKERPRKGKEDLDDELDAFLRERDSAIQS